MATQALNPDVQLKSLYRRLLALNREAFAAGYYDVAYHALAGALHCVQTLQDRQGLEEIKGVAEEQLAWIDLHAPEYEHSSRSASGRGHPSIYHSLARQAEVRLRMIVTEHKMASLTSRKPASEG